MKCANCGGKMTADMKFCGACGTPVEHTEPAAVDTVPDSPKDKADGTRLKIYSTCSNRHCSCHPGRHCLEHLQAFKLW